MKLLNVRLDRDDSRLATELREAGVQISHVVREAIRTEHERRIRRRGSGPRASTIMARIYAEYPDPPHARRRRLDLHDRKAVRRVIAKHLSRRRP